MSPGSGEWQVPVHESHELRAKASRHCVLIPVIDEGERILGQLRRMREQALPDVILADGGSRDGSTEPHRLRELGVRTLLVKTGPGKLGAQLRMGFAYALRQGYEGVVLVDGNGKDDTAAIHDFVHALDEGWDYVQGSRFVPGGAAVRNPAWRLAAIRAIHAPAISLAARFRYTDTTNGFRACSARLLRDERVALFRDALSGYELHYYLSIRAARLGFRVKELPVRREYPATGPLPSKISFVRGNLRVLRALVLACLGRFDPPGTP
jgi:dolichol-phosphate mannosyltransferase